MQQHAVEGAEVDLAGAAMSGAAGEQSERVNTCLADFQPIANPALNWVAKALPYMVLLVLLVTTLVGGTDVMFLTGMLAAAGAAFLFQRLLRELPEVLTRLWTRQVLTLRTDAGRGRGIGRGSLLLRRWQGPPSNPTAPRESGDLADHFLGFVEGFERDLNHPYSWLCAAFITGLMWLSFPLRLYPVQHWQRHVFDWVVMLFMNSDITFLAFVVSQLGVAMVLGLLVWRMVIVARSIRRLGDVFDIAVQAQHPDRSGGLEPVGALCLTNALILTLPATYLAGWLMAIPAFGTRHNPYAAWVQYYESLLSVVFVLAILAFIRPLSGVHRAMYRHRARLRSRLDNLGHRIDATAQKLVSEAKDANPERLEALTRQLQALNAVYAANSRIPVWPFDNTVVQKFTLAQLIPLLSVSGLGPSLVSAITRMIH